MIEGGSSGRLALRSGASRGLLCRLCEDLLRATHLVFHLHEAMVSICLLLPGLRRVQIHILQAEGRRHTLLHDLILDVSALTSYADDGVGNTACVDLMTHPLCGQLPLSGRWIVQKMHR